MTFGKIFGAFPLVVGLVLVAAIACGAPADDPTQPPTIDGTPQTSPTPVAGATPAPGTPAAVTAAGVLNVGIGMELGPFASSPRLSAPPTSTYVALTAFESLLYWDVDGNLIPRLAEDWSMSEDGTVLTFNLRQGIPFHKGYGEMTAADVIHSYQMAAADDSIHSRAGQIRGWWTHPDGWAEALDDHTLQVNIGEYQFGVEVNLQAPGRGNWIVSQNQVDDLGEEEASRQGAGTGPWESVEFRSGELWRFEAVPEHWRKTPEFSELILWELPEESSRTAGLLTGRLDTSHLATESLPRFENEPGFSFIGIPDSGFLNVQVYQWYIGVGTDQQRPGFNPNRPWISADPDPTSEEWARARMVREALSLAIDREAIVETLLLGRGEVARGPHPFLGNEERLYPDIRYDYDPERAMELLAEAGYPQGFELDLTTYPRGTPADVESCEAIADMWGAIGVQARLQRVPYTTFRPGIVSRTYEGAACHPLPNYISPTEGFIGGMRSAAIFNHGMEHPWLDEMIERAITTVDITERELIEDEVGRFVYDNVLIISIAKPEITFPVGPKVAEWPLVLNVERRHLNNFEYARPRQ